MVAATIPIGVFGFLFQHQAESAWRTPNVIGAMMIVIGGFLWWAERAGRKLKDLGHLSFADAMSVGFAQVLAIVPGVALGIGIAILCEPGLGLATFVGAAGVPLYVDLPALVVTVVALVGVVAVAVAAGTWLSRRVRMADALRIGDD